jgi:hypothetical protein
MALTLAAVAFPFFSELLPKQLANAVAREPISTVVEALSGLIPSFASRWKESLEVYPLEFGLLLIGIGITLVGSQTLENRIHDRARLVWHRGPVQQYRDWRDERRRGLGRLVIAGLILLAAKSIVFQAVGKAYPEPSVAVTAGLLALGYLIEQDQQRERPS